MSFKLFIVFVAITFMGLFVVQNMEVVSVDFLIWSLQASRILIFLSIFLIGVLIGWIGKSLR